jgi:hypothetical protein
LERGRRFFQTDSSWFLRSAYLPRRNSIPKDALFFVSLSEQLAWLLSGWRRQLCLAPFVARLEDAAVPGLIVGMDGAELAEYFLTTIPDGLNNRQNNFRFSAGVVFRFG